MCAARGGATGPLSNMSLSKMAMGSTSASGAEDAGDAAITSHVELQNYVLSAAEKSTAIVTKVGSRRGGKKLHANRRELMGKNVTLLSGDPGRALVQPRCVFPCQLHRRELHRLLTAICFLLCAEPSALRSRAARRFSARRSRHVGEHVEGSNTSRAHTH